MGFETNFLTGIAELLAGQAIGTWRATGVYDPTETGIVFDTVPASPDQVITLADYAVSDRATLSESTIGLQISTRWGGQNPTPVKDLDGLIFAFLHGMPALTMTNGIHIVSCLRNSGASLGQDSNNRWGRVSNYYVKVHRPSTNRT